MNVFYFRHNAGDKTTHEIAENVINYNELTFVIKGELKYFVNGKPYVVKQNDCIFVKKQALRKRLPETVCDYFSFNFLDDLDFELPTHSKNCITKEIKMLLFLCDELSKKYYDFKDKLSDALKLILTLIKGGLSLLEENPVIIKIKRFVQNNLDKSISLLDISKEVGYTPNYCDALFKKHVGKPIITFVNEEKTEKAKLLMQEGVLTLKEIAEAVGFYDYNYFSRTFKKIYGYSPKNYLTNAVKFN